MWNNTEGNEAINPNVGRSESSVSKENLMNVRLDSDYEPVGS